MLPDEAQLPHMPAFHIWSSLLALSACSCIPEEVQGPLTRSTTHIFLVAQPAGSYQQPAFAAGAGDDDMELDEGAPPPPPPPPEDMVGPARPPDGYDVQAAYAQPDAYAQPEAYSAYMQASIAQQASPACSLSVLLGSCLLLFCECLPGVVAPVGGVQITSLHCSHVCI